MTGCIEVSEVQGELDSNILKALCAALISRAVLHRQEDGGITGRSSAWHDGPTCIYQEMMVRFPKSNQFLASLHSQLARLDLAAGIRSSFSVRVRMCAR